MTAILGISAFYHDAAAALVVDGRIVAAAQEERFTRHKYDPNFPVRAVAYCLAEGKLTLEQIDYVGFYDKPILKFDRLLETYLAYAPVGFSSFVRAIPLWLKKKLHLPREMRKALNYSYRKRFVFSEHHESHAASAFFPSPFEEAAILTLDGVGEWATASYGIGRGNRIELTHEQRFPHSVGMLYSAFTYYCGFEVNSGEYKLMGLAPYGTPRYVDMIRDNLMDLKEDGSFHLDMSYFNYCQGLTMTSERFHALFGLPPRKIGSKLDPRYADIAASIQKITEDIMLRSARHVYAQTGMTNLCLAGGVALNCVGNGRILREGPFEKIWIQPAAGDAGGALGVALLIWYQLLNNDRVGRPEDHQHGSLLGIAFSNEQIDAFLKTTGAVYRRFDNTDSLCIEVADAIAEGKVIGWFQDRMEFGPRALGSRSILGDARHPDMQGIINSKIKFREGFRPFAPIVLREHAHEYFDLKPDQESPYMLLVTSVRDDKRISVGAEHQSATGLEKLNQRRSVIPSVTHVDYSVRVQTVDPQRHGLLRNLLATFYKKTACPVMVNTSFNSSWEPIVCTPAEAYRTFMSSDMDVLCMGNTLLRKSEQSAEVATGDPHKSETLFANTLASPCCHTSLQHLGSKLVCSACNRVFGITENIAQLYWPHDGIDDPDDVTAKVKAFYEECPFPNYDDHDSIASLIEKSRQGIYARHLDASIPFNSRVLEVGCGTGQLTNFLGVGSRQVIGSDICMNSLRLGEEFRGKHNLTRVRFVQMNLFRPALQREQFDFVLCNGVLHHTSDPYGGFKNLVALVKPGGHIVLRLYNAYGRLFTDLRRLLVRLSGGRAEWVDPLLRKGTMSVAKRRAWFSHQYLHPHESKHTYGEVLAWFDQQGIDFVRSIPAMRPDDDSFEGENLFSAQPRGSTLERFIVQATQIVAPGQKEGGFFIMIGKKRGHVTN